MLQREKVIIVELADIKKSLSESTDEELVAMLSGIRNSRRTPKVNPTKPKPVRAAQTAKSEPSLDALLNGMTKDQIAQLMLALGGGK